VPSVERLASSSNRPVNAAAGSRPSQSGQQAAPLSEHPTGQPTLPRTHWAPDFWHLAVASAVAVIAAILLPFAPVIGERPVVSWPQTATAPTSTALLLTNGTPESLYLRFSCAAALRAETGDGVLFSTMRPEEPTLEKVGLVVRVADSTITLATGGRRFALGPANHGTCDVVTRVDGTGLTVTRNGDPLVAHQALALPNIDGLITGVGPAPAATSDDLSVRIHVVDVFASSATFLKWALILVVALAALSVLGVLFWADRSTTNSPKRAGRARENRPKFPSWPRYSRTRSWWLLRLPDVVVIVIMLGWVAIAPTTDDDGYYSSMARNAAESGYVGNYYQMWNQSFTPFAWLWQALSVWQRLGGDSVVWLRLPALAAGLVTWFALRSFTTKVGKAAGAVSRRWMGSVLAIAFLAWWLPYCMGVRPETVVAMFASLALLLVAQAVETGRLSRAALAATLGGVGAAAHPTGFVILAPLIVAMPAMWRLQRTAHGLRGAAVRAFAVVAAASPAGIAAFGDGTWHDFVAGQARFQAVETPLNWTDELQRYQFLLTDIPMGSYAKRVPIMLALTLLLWFVVLHVAARVGRVSLPGRTSFAGWCLVASFILLWLTPSKWTHHFGSLSGVGPAFVTLLLVTGMPAIRELTQRQGGPGVIPWVFAGSLVPPIALSLQGPNLWAYWWNLGMPRPVQAPTLRDVPLGSPAFVLAAFAGVTALVWLWMRRSRHPLPAWGFLVSVIVLVGVLGGSVLYLVRTFGLSTARTMSSYSPGSANIRDPLGCSASKAVSVYDDRTARPLESATVPVEGDQQSPFVSGGGYWPGSRPPGGAGDGPSRQVWGSFTQNLEAATGDFTSNWYVLPKDRSTGDRVVTFLSGRTDGVSTLTVEFGRRAGSAVSTVLQRRIEDREDSTGWRAEVIAGPDDVPAGADVVRLVAHDGETNSGGWLAFTAPERQSAVSLNAYIPAHSPVTVSWQFAFLFPCEDQLTVIHGITQPPEYAITWPFSTLASEATWQLQRGGLAAPAARLGSLVSPASYLTDSPDVTWGHVYHFQYPYSRSAYDLTIERVEVPGWRGVVPDRVGLSEVQGR